MPTKDLNSVLLRVNLEARDALHSMLGFVAAIENEELSENQRGHLSRCRNAAIGLTRTLADAAEYAGLTPPAVEAPREFPITRMIEAATDVYGMMARGKGVQLHCQVDDNVPSRCTGPSRTTEQILGRLLDNAISFTSRGEVCVRVQYIPGPISDRLRITIEDTGPGIPPEILRQLESGGSADANPGELAGFGLVLARQQAILAGGELRLRNRPDGGCQAVMEVAIVAERSASDMQIESVKPAAIASQLSILVAEDSDDSYELMEMFLESQGHALHRAWDGIQAVRLAQRAAFDLLILDVHMPLLDGYAAAQQIRMWETVSGLPHVPIVMLSGDPLQKQIQRGALTGCSGYLEKPVSQEMLIKTIAAFAPV